MFTEKASEQSLDLLEIIRHDADGEPVFTLTEMGKLVISFWASEEPPYPALPRPLADIIEAGVDILNNDLLAAKIVLAFVPGCQKERVAGATDVVSLRAYMRELAGIEEA